MTKRKLRKNADISPPQSPHDGIHTCSKGCKKPGCNRTLRETIEEQDQQIEALKRDVLEKAAELRKSEEHNEALCERMQDLNGEVHTASCANANMHKENARLKAEVERLTKAGDSMADEIISCYRAEGYDPADSETIPKWNAAKEGKGQP